MAWTRKDVGKIQSAHDRLAAFGLLPEFKYPKHPREAGNRFIENIPDLDMELEDNGWKNVKSMGHDAANAFNDAVDVYDSLADRW